MDIKKRVKNKILILSSLFLFASLFFTRTIADAATLTINSNAQTLSVGETTTLSVILNTEGVAINNAEAFITVPVDMFDIVSVSNRNSVFSLWVEEPSFSNSTGVITLNGGVPTPGFNGSQGNVISIVVRAQKEGEATIAFSNAAVRANDGFGTDVLTRKQGKTIIITSSNKEVVQETILQQVEKKISNVVISSKTHPNRDAWYKNSTIDFEWTIPSGANSVQTGIGSSSSAIPRVTYTPPIIKKTIENLEDGVSYFKVRARNGSIWGAISTYIVRVDTTAPEMTNASLSYDDITKNLTISASAQDITSGIDRYEIRVNDTLVKTIPVQDFNGTYTLLITEPGKSVITFSAIDRAGNAVEFFDTINVTAIADPILDPVPNMVASDKHFLVTGITMHTRLDTVLKIQSQKGDVQTIPAIVNDDNTFFAVVPKLTPQKYTLWVEVGADTGVVQSQHRTTKVTSNILLTIGNYSIPLLYVLIPILFGFPLGAIAIAYYFGSYFSTLQYRKKKALELVKQDDLKTLFSLKNRLENHLEILQNTRRDRILTKEEKDMKIAIEDDLDEIDRTLKGT